MAVSAATAVTSCRLSWFQSGRQSIKTYSVKIHSLLVHDRCGVVWKGSSASLMVKNHYEFPRKDSSTSMARPDGHENLCVLSCQRVWCGAEAENGTRPASMLTCLQAALWCSARMWLERSAWPGQGRFASMIHLVSSGSQEVELLTE